MGFIEKPQLKGGLFKTKTSRENTMSEELKRMICESKCMGKK